MTPVRLAWLLCLWATGLLLQGAAEQAAQARVKAARESAQKQELQSLSRLGYEAALKKLRQEPAWSGELNVPAEEKTSCKIRVINHLFSPYPVAEGAELLPPHSIVIKGTIVFDKPGPKLVTNDFQDLVEFRRPRFAKGLSSDLGPFTAPLPAAPPSASGQVATDTQLAPGAYDAVVVGPGVTASLEPVNGYRVYRFRTLRLQRGAKLQVTDYAELPAVVYITESLVLEGANQGNWSNDGPGRAAMLQLYGTSDAGIWFTDCSKLSLVAAAPGIYLTRCRLNGALAAGQSALTESEVTYEPELQDLYLNGLGPMQMKSALSDSEP